MYKNLNMFESDPTDTESSKNNKPDVLEECAKKYFRNKEDKVWADHDELLINAVRNKLCGITRSQLKRGVHW